MADGFEITIRGLNEIGAKLLAFSEAVANKVIRDGANKAAEVFQEEAIFNVRASDGPHNLKVKGKYIKIYPGNLKQNIKIKTLRRMVKGQIDVQVYVKKDHSWYGIFVENGSSRMAAQHYMARAYETKKDEVPAIFQERIEQAIREGGL
jgi:HK97 gp10 family phage protein